MHLGNLANLQWLWIVAATIAAVTIGAALRRRALKRFAEPALLQHLLPAVNRRRRALKLALLAGGMLLIVAALLDPRWGRRWRDVPEHRLNVMLVLDVSQSMLAQDASPSRLERAKLQIGDMLAAMEGTRAGLIAFAGDARQIVPLTMNPREITSALSEIGPASIGHGGSQLDRALHIAAESLVKIPGDERLAVVWTDGEDHDGATAEVARELFAQQNIHLCIVGIGDVENGARIPLADGGHLQFEGQDVVSRMNPGLLREIAAAGNGIFVPAGVRQVDMGEVYQSYAAKFRRPGEETSRVREFVPRYPWFLGAALVLIVFETMLGDAPRRREAVA